jgi:hypothetical protein
VLDRLLGGRGVFFFSSRHYLLPAPRLVLLLVRLTSVALVRCCPFSCGVLSACFDSYVAIVSVDTACNEGCGFCCWLHVHLHAAACAWLVFGALGLLGLWRALRPGPGGAHCEPHQGTGPGCASLLCCFRGRPLRVTHRTPCRVAVRMQPQYNTAHAGAFKWPAHAPKCPPQAY